MILVDGFLMMKRKVFYALSENAVYTDDGGEVWEEVHDSLCASIAYGNS